MDRRPRRDHQALDRGRQDGPCGPTASALHALGDDPALRRFRPPDRDAQRRQAAVQPAMAGGQGEYQAGDPDGYRRAARLIETALRIGVSVLTSVSRITDTLPSTGRDIRTGPSVDRPQDIANMVDQLVDLALGDDQRRRQRDDVAGSADQGAALER